MELIRVAQIMGKLWAGGVEAVVFNYYRKIDKTKVQFDFYYDADSTVEPPKELIDMGARFYRIPPYQQLPSYLKILRSYFRNNNYKIVHSHINTLSVFPLYTAWCEKVPVRIAHNHSVLGGDEFKRNALKCFLKGFSKIFPTDYFACSEKAGRWMFGNNAFNKGKVFVVKNAIDFKKFRPDVSELKREMGLERKFVVGHIGRLTYAKNHKFLLEVFEEIVKKREDAVLLLVGDGELHDEIVGEIEKRKLKERVIMVGKVCNPEKYYRLANVIVIPSLFEGFSLSTIESQIAGVPVVTSEAIPDEAVISNGCERVKLNESAKKWTDVVIKMSKKKVELDSKAKSYNINNAVIGLEDKYVKLIEGE